jgi:hypothetical protein
MTDSSRSDRRQWIKTAAGLSAAVTLAELSHLGRVLADQGVTLQPDPSLDLFRVRVELEIEGNINITPSAAVTATKDKVKGEDKSKEKPKAMQVPVESTAVLDCEERILASATDGTAQVADRFYHEAKSTGTVGNRPLELTLRPDSRKVRVQHQDSQWVAYSNDVYLDGRELELLKVPASSLAVDALLPTGEVQSGTKYTIDSPVLAKWLALASVEQSTVQGEVLSVADQEVKLQLAGTVEGSVAGVPTTIELAAKLTFDRVARCCTWVAVGMKEVRQIGKSEPGFEVAATIRMVRKPMEAPVRLGNEPATDWKETPPAERLLTELASTALGYSVLMDRRWKIINDVAGSGMIRLIDNDSVIAQVNIHPLGKLAAGEQLTLEAFVAESRKSLGNRFGEVLKSTEELNGAGLRVLRVTIQGSVESVPIQWVFMQFSDDSGRRLLATMTISNDYVANYAGGDEQLSSSLRFLALNDQTMGVAKQPGDAAEKR